MKYDTQVIVEAIKKAAQGALAHRSAEDGGACNFDCAYISVPGMRDSQASEIGALAGIPVSLTSSRWAGRILQVLIGEGQANRRTMMAKAAADSLTESLAPAGLNVSMYYQMD